MKRTASVLSFLLAIFLVGTAVVSAIQDVNEAPDRIRQSFADLNRNDSAALNQDIQAHQEAQHFMAFEAIGGGVLLIAGFALWERKPEQLVDTPH